MRTSSLYQQFTTAVLVAVALTTPAAAQKKGGGGTSAPPPVRYETVWLGTDAAEVFDINDAGQVVGRTFGTTPSRAFRADVNASSATASVYDLNAFGSPWIDLGNGGSATGWTAVNAIAINGDGWIVGRAENTAAVSRAFLYSRDSAGVWSFFLLPPVTVGDTTYPARAATGINDWGQVVGILSEAADGKSAVFTWNLFEGSRSLGFLTTDIAKVNGAGIVFADDSPHPSSRQCVRYDLETGQLDTIAGVSIYNECLNELGEIAGERVLGTKSSDAEIIRFSQPTLADATTISSMGTALAIDDAGSVLFEKFETVKGKRVSSLLLYRDGHTPLNVAACATQWPGYWGGRTFMSNPDVTGFGIIASGSYSAPAYVLVPRLP